MASTENDYGELIISDQITQNFVHPLKILNLCANLSNHTTSVQVQVLINKFIQEITNSPYVFIIPILTNNDEGLIQVIGDKILEKEMRFAITAENIKNASSSGFNFLINDVGCSFRKVIEMLVGTQHNTLFFDIKELNKNTKSILREMVLLDEITPRSTETGLTNCSLLIDEHSEEPSKISFFVGIAGGELCRTYYRYCIYETLRFTIGHLLSAVELDEEGRIRKRCADLLQILKNLTGKIDGFLIPNHEVIGNRTYTIKADIIQSKTPYIMAFESMEFGLLLDGIMVLACEEAGAETSNIFLIDKSTKELVSKVVDNSKYPNEIRIEDSSGIIAHILETGNIVNVHNPLYYDDIDVPLGIKTRNILYFPIYDNTSIIGIGQLINKINGYHFDKRDEEVAKIFSTFISLSIVDIVIYKSVRRAEALIKVAQDLIIYHMKTAESEVKSLIEVYHQLKNNQNKIQNLSSFTFVIRDLNPTEMLNASIQMFVDLDFINKFQIDIEKLARFILKTVKAYRDLPYHNWTHAVTVAHFAYTLLMNCNLVGKGILRELDALSFLISGFCHDIDHRGKTNFYHMESNDVLAGLHANQGSINERHHFSLTVAILNNSNLLSGLTKEQFASFMNATKKFILSTDLTHHINILKALSELRRDNINAKNRSIAMSLLITCCDLNDQIKPWPHSKYVSHLISTEFFAQGDLEKQMGIIPLEIMDREKAVIPRLQTQFLESLVLPVFKILANILPETEYLLDNITDNIKQFQELEKEENNT